MAQIVKETMLQSTEAKGCIKSWQKITWQWMTSENSVEKKPGESSKAPGTESHTITEERASSCTADGALSSSLEGQVHGKESES